MLPTCQGAKSRMVKGPSSVSPLLGFFFYIKKTLNLEITVTSLILGVVRANFLWFWDKLFLTFEFPQIWKIWRGFLTNHGFQKLKISKVSYFHLQHFFKFMIIREKLISGVYYCLMYILTHEMGTPKWWFSFLWLSYLMKLN